MTTIYGISITQKLESTEIIKETPKQYQLRITKRLSWYGYSTRISKDDPRLAFSPEEALVKFTNKQLGKIARLENEITTLRQRIERAENAVH